MTRQKNTTWWNRSIVENLTKDIIIDTWCRLRPSQSSLIRNGKIDSPDFDSLERIQVASELNIFFELHQVGLEDNLLTTNHFNEWVDIICQSLQIFDQSIGFRTSGTTGEPVVHSHKISTLLEEINFWRQLLGPFQSVAGVVPSHHIYGFLFTILLPAQSKVPYVDLRNCLPSTIAQAVKPNSIFIGYPEFWLLINDSVINFPKNITGITSTAPCEDQLADQLLSKHLSRLIQIYGSTETAGIGWRDQAAKPYQLLPFWNHKDEYLNRKKPQDNDLKYKTPDILQWFNDRFFNVTRRRDRAVQVNGINIYPDQIAAKLMQFREVKSASVRLLHTDQGNRLKAFIVPTDLKKNRDELLQEITQYSLKNLQPLERPKVYTFGNELPKGIMGKTKDWVNEL